MFLSKSSSLCLYSDWTGETEYLTQLEKMSHRLLIIWLFALWLEEEVSWL